MHFTYNNTDSRGFAFRKLIEPVECILSFPHSVLADFEKIPYRQRKIMCNHCNVFLSFSIYIRIYTCTHYALFKRHQRKTSIQNGV